VRECGDVSVLDLRGRSTIDDGESESLSGHLKKLVDSGVRKLLLNLADVTKIDSSGISIIVETCVSLRKRGGDLRLLCPRGRVLEVLTVVRLLNAIPSFENEARAVASFGERGNFATP
jgi:anti-sigma B factor antagonist